MLVSLQVETGICKDFPAAEIKWNCILFEAFYWLSVNNPSKCVQSRSANSGNRFCWYHKYLEMRNKYFNTEVGAYTGKQAKTHSNVHGYIHTDTHIQTQGWRHTDIDTQTKGTQTVANRHRNTDIYKIYR